MNDSYNKKTLLRLRLANKGNQVLAKIITEKVKRDNCYNYYTKKSTRFIFTDVLLQQSDRWNTLSS